MSVLCRGTWKRAIFCHYCNALRPPLPLSRSPLPSVQSALCPSSQSRSHLPFSTLLLRRSPLHFCLLRSATLPLATSSLLYLFVARIIATLGPLPVLPLSISLFCSRVPSAPSLPVETHALTHQPIRPCDARLYRGCTTWPLANYLSSCSCASKRREGLPPREGFFFDHPGANIDKVNVAVSGYTRDNYKEKRGEKGGKEKGK